MSDYESVDLDANGYPVLVDLEEIQLANAKLNNSVSSVVGVSRPALSGNPWFDPTSGRFANGPQGVAIKGGAALLARLLNSSKAYISTQAARIGADAMSAAPGTGGQVKITLYKLGAPVVSFMVPSKDTPANQAQVGSELTQHGAPGDGPNVNSVPAGVDPAEWHRRMDAVREAAREFDHQSLQDIREFLLGKTKRPLSDTELRSFEEDVRRQRLSDLVDVLDNSIRRRVADRLRFRRTVKVVPPRGWLRRSLAHLEDSEIADLHRRLLARGFSAEELQSHLINRYPEDRRSRLVSLVGDVKENSDSTTAHRRSPDPGQ